MKKIGKQRDIQRVANAPPRLHISAKPSFYVALLLAEVVLLIASSAILIHSYL